MRLIRLAGGNLGGDDERLMTVRRVIFVLLGGGLAVEGCGETGPSAGSVRASDPVAPSAPVGTMPGPPATTVFLPPDANVPPVMSLAPSVVTEPCPSSEPTPGDGQGMMAEQSRLEPMLGQVLAYGAQYPDQFGTYGLIWHDDGSASVFVSFTADVESTVRRCWQPWSIPRT